MRIKPLPVLLVVVLFLVGFVLSASYLTFKSTVDQVIVTPRAQASATPSPTPDPLAEYGVLLLGLRGDNSQGGLLTDTLILAHIKPREESVNLISIPRDLWVPIPINGMNTEHAKINAAYAIGLDDRKYTQKDTRFTGAGGGGALAKHVIQEIFGIPVRYFVSLDFEGFQKSIDVLGGVDVPVTRAFEDPYYPITGMEADPCGKTEEEIDALTATLSGDILEHSFPCRYELLQFEKGLIHMNGETALKYARSRHSLTNGTDFARSTRQKEIMLAVKEKILQIGFLPKAIPFVQSLAGDLRTDIPLEEMAAYAGQVNQIRNYKVTSSALSTDNALDQTYSADRQYILVPKSGMDNWTSIRQFLSPTPLPQTNQ